MGKNAKIPAAAPAQPAGAALAARPLAMARMGVLIALLAVSAQVSVVIGPVPFTLQTLVVTLVALVLPPAQAAATLGGYVLLGALGLPVFSLMRGGLAMIAGPTGGFIYGFVLSALLGSLVRRAICGRGGAGSTPRAGARQLAGDIACLVVVLVVCYAVGTVHFMLVGSVSFDAAGLVSSLALTVLPFILPDVLKGAAAILVSAALHRAIPTLGR